MKKPATPKTHGAKPRAPRAGRATVKRTNKPARLAARQRAGTGHASLTHAQCQEMLDWYAGDEQRGLEVQKLYPAVAAHLQICDACREQYDLYRFAMQARADPAAQFSPPRLAFLSPLPRSSWFQEKPSQLLGPAQSIGFWLNPTYLKSLFEPQVSPSTRGFEFPGEERLLFDDDTNLGDQPIHLQSWIDRVGPDRLLIRVEVFSIAPLPEPLVAHLDWQGQAYAQPLVSGKATFENVPPPDFSKHFQDEPVPDFRLILAKS